MKLDDLNVGIVQDALPFIGGAEKLLEVVLSVFTNAPIYTLVYNEKAFRGTIFEKRKIVTSFIDKLPGSRRSYRRYLPVLPVAIERFDLRDHDLILSFSYAVAHGIVPRPEQIHISFIYTPLRYTWQHYHEYLEDYGYRSGVRGWLINLILHYLRLWDRLAADRVDYFVAVSNWVEKCIWRAYRRPARVIYPPVDVEKFKIDLDRSDRYVTVSRLAPHKKIATIVDAFSRLGLPLIVVGEGDEYTRLKKLAKDNIRFLGWVPDERLRQLLGQAKGLIHAAEEDFGIALVEAQAAGCPVIAYGKGGAKETVIHGETGILYPHQTAEAIVEAVQDFERGVFQFDPRHLRRHAERFDRKHFIKNLTSLVGNLAAGSDEIAVTYNDDVYDKFRDRNRRV